MRSKPSRFALCFAAALTVGILVGCHSDRPSQVPATAKFQKVSRKAVEFTAPADGTVYIVDDWDTSLLYSGPIRKGQTLAIDPDARKITLDGQAASVDTKKMTATDRSIFFQANGQ